MQTHLLLNLHTYFTQQVGYDKIFENKQEETNTNKQTNQTNRQNRQNKQLLKQMNEYYYTCMSE